MAKCRVSNAVCAARRQATVRRVPADGLKIGDKCHVNGEGDDVFRIVGAKMCSPDRPGLYLIPGGAKGFTSATPRRTRMITHP